MGEPNQQILNATATSSSTTSSNTIRKQDIAKIVATTTAASVAKGAHQLAKNLTTKRKDGVLPKAVSDCIQQIEELGDSKIDRMVVVRTPVQAYVGLLMQIVSFGEYENVISGSDYDTMFHLSILINGRYVLEKNEVIVLRDGESPKNVIEKGSETMAVRIPATTIPLTFTSLLENTKQGMGPHKFTNYCAKTNNCQDFILAVLESNGLANPLLISFLKQNSEEIFNKLPIHTTTVARALTDAAAVGDKLCENIIAKQREAVLNIVGGGKELLNKGGRALGRDKLCENITVKQRETVSNMVGGGKELLNKGGRALGR